MPLRYRQALSIGSFRSSVRDYVRLSLILFFLKQPVAGAFMYLHTSQTLAFEHHHVTQQMIYGKIHIFARFLCSQQLAR